MTSNGARYIVLTGSSERRWQALSNLEDVVNSYRPTCELGGDVIFLGGVSITYNNTPQGKWWFAPQAILLNTDATANNLPTEIGREKRIWTA